MPDTFGDWSATPGSNTSVAGVNIAEGCLPGNVNNALRQIMAACNLSFGDLPSGTSRPSYLAANKLWRDTSVAGEQTIKFYDGTDDITVFTVDTTNNEVTYQLAAGSVTPAMLADTDFGVFTVASGVATLDNPIAQTVNAGQQVLLSGTLTPAEITADQNDYNPSGLADASYLRVSSDAARTITGLAGGAGGRVVVIFNVGSFTIALSNQNASSAAGNRFHFPGGRSLELESGEVTALRYDGVNGVWRQATTTGLEFDTDNKGLAPASGGGTTNFLRADGSWAAPTAAGGGLVAVTVFTASGTWTPDSGASTALIICTGGGGGGESVTSGNNGAGGGAGATAIDFVADTGAAGTPSVTIGAGGGLGSAGGQSSVGSLAVAGGGGGGGSGTGGSGGTATAGDLLVTGGTGGDAPGGTDTAGYPGASFWGGEDAYGSGGRGDSDGTGWGSGTDGVVLILEW